MLNEYKPPRMTKPLKTYMIRRFLMKSNFVFVNQFSVIFEEKVMLLFFSRREKIIKRVMTIALNKDVKIPMIKVVANPRMAPLPKL